MRRLPVYLLIDTSGSMYGEPIAAVGEGLQTLLASLRQDPYALETAFLSVIEFNTEATQVVPLTDLISFNMPDLKAQGVTSLGAALSLLSNKLVSEVKRNTEQQKGDWRPLVFIFSDGAATDDLAKGIQTLKATQALKTCNTGIVVACAAGPYAKHEELKKITDNVVTMEKADAKEIEAFFQWVSASISTNSQRVETGGADVSELSELPPPPPAINVVDLSKRD